MHRIASKKACARAATMCALGLTASTGFLGAFTGMAHAQTKYLMTTLRPSLFNSGPAGQPLFADLNIDSQDRAVLNLDFYEGMKLVAESGSITGFRLKWQPSYRTYMARYPATTAISILPTKLNATSTTLSAVSPSGNILFSGLGKITLQPAGSPDTSAIGIYRRVWAINDKGAMVGTLWKDAAFGPQSVPGMTPPSSATSKELAQPDGYRGGAATAINSRDEAVGEVYASSDWRPAAVRWTSAGVELLPTPAGKGSAAMAVSEQGQVLMGVFDYARTPDAYDTPETPSYRVTMGQVDWSIYTNGQATALTCTLPGYPAPVPEAMSPAGVVVGRCEQGPVSASTVIAGGIPGESLGNARNVVGPTYARQNGRAVIWKDGVMSDLSTYLAGKGIKVPVDAVFVNASAINAKSSILAEYFDAAGRYSVLRLTAKP